LSRSGWFRRIRFRYPPARALVGALVLLLVFTGTFQQALDDYARDLINRRAQERAVALAAPAPINTLPETEPLTQVAPPAPSGAHAPYPLNHSLDGDTVYPGGEVANFDFEAAPQTVGSPPTNHQFSDAPTSQGTQLTNFDFNTGTLAPWIGPTGVTIQTSGGPDNQWARLTSSGILTSEAFTPESDAQAISFDYGAFNTAGSNTAYVYILSGASYGTSTLAATLNCANCNQWQSVEIGIGQWKGQSIKIQFARSSGTIGIDRVRKLVLFPGYETAGNVARIMDGGDGYASIADLLTSAPFTVDPTAQHVTLSLRGLSQFNDQAYVKVLSGAGYGTVTTFTPSLTDAWATYRFNFAAFAGQSIKLQIDVVTGRVGVDEVGVMRIDAPSWTLDSGLVTPVGGESSGTAANVSGQITSSAVTLPADVQHLTLRYKTAASGLFWELLSGPSFATVTSLGLVNSNGAWATHKAGVSEFGGQSVKLRVRAQLAAVTVDTVGLLENVIPGWRVLQVGVAAVASDANGTYVTSATTNGTLTLESSPISPGYVNGPGANDLRSYVLAYSWSSAQNSKVRVEYTALDGSNYYLLGHFNGGAANSYQTARVPIYDFTAAPGKFTITLFNGARLYALGDNVARQQLAEPFSQQVGDHIDTSTGSYGTSETDLTLAGGPMPLVLTRYYSAHSDRLGALGYRWSHSYDTFLAIQPDGSVAVVFGSGHEEYFEWNPLLLTFRAGDPRIKSTLTKVTGQPYTYLYETKSGLRYAFTGNGDLISITDRNSQSILLYRNANNQVTAIADPGGRQITLTYDGSGRLATATDPEGAVVTYGYDGNGDLTAVAKPEDGRSEYVYSRHRLTAIKVRTGETLATSQMTTVVTNTLDEFNRVIAQTDDRSATFALSYQDPANGVTTVTDPTGGVSYFYFEEHARTRFIDFPGDESRTFVYDSTGNLAKNIDGANNETIFGYDPQANITDLTDPVGNPSNFTYSAFNLPTEFTDAGGQEWLFDYDLDGNVTEATNPLGKSWTYTYDGAGNKTSETNPLNQTWTYTYLNNHLVEKTDPLGNIWSYTWSPNGWMTSQEDPEGNVTSWTYRLGGLVTSYTDPTGATWSYGYDMLGQIVAISDPAGKISTFVYFSALGKPSMKLDAESELWEFTYDPNGNMTSQTDGEGNVIAWEFDANNHITRRVADPNPTGQSGHLAITTAYEYYPNGRVWKEIVDPTDADPGVELNRVTTYTYDDAGRATAVQYPNGGVTSYTYDYLGNVATETDPLSRVTTYQYDIAGRLVLVTEPGGVRTRYEYDAANQRTRTIVDPTHAPDGTPYSGTHANLASITTYDAAGRVESEQSPTGMVTRYARDGNGNPTTVTVDYGAGRLNLETHYEYDGLSRAWRTTDALGRTTTRSWDTRGRLVQVIAGASATEPGIVTAYTYDDLDQLLSVTVDPTDPATPRVEENLVTSYAYDGAGRRIAVTNPRNYTTEFEYDAAGRMTEIRDAVGGAVAFSYNAAGEITQLTNPRSLTTTFTYDGLGNLTSQTDPLNRTWSWEYDLAGQLVEQTDALTQIQTYRYWDDGQLRDIRDAGGATTYLAYGYDSAGRTSSLADATGTTTWSYTTGGELASAASPQGTLAYTYDSAGRLDSLTSPGNRTVTYGYDVASQLTSVTDWQNETTTFGYASTGALGSVSRPNGVSTAYRYDYAGRLSVVEHADGPTMLARYLYGLDDNGNRETVAISGAAVAAGTESYGYDPLDRLTSATYPGGGAVSYAYDPNGNRGSVTSGGVVTTYEVDDADQLTALKDNTNTVIQSYSYDANGNRIASGPNTYAYDWNNQLSTATVSGSTVTYAYTGDGLRAGRTVAGVTTNFLWDRQAGLPELIDDGTSITVQSPIGALAQVDTATGDGTYPLADGLGTARVQTDDAGTVTGTADYDAYGNVRASSGSQSREGWAGESRDATTGLTHLRARDYDPLTGRFTSADTVSPNGSGTQGYNAYHYTGNNPTTRTDPSGHSWLDAMPAMLRALIDLVVQMVETLRVVMRMDNLPDWGKQFIAALIVFGLQVVMTVIVVTLLVWILAASGLGRFPIANVLIFARMHILGNMMRFTAMCVRFAFACGGGLTGWLTRNPDCAAQVGQVGAAYGMYGAPGFGRLGIAEILTDAADILIECADPNASDNTPDRPRPRGRLRDRMKAAGDNPPDQSYQAHHIVADGAKRAQPARDTLARFSIDLNDPVNGVWLPANKNSPKVDNAAVHSPLHSNDYYDYVNESLADSQSRDDVIRTLDKIRSELEQGGYGP
jgi:RHS repeat-associated protein